jgi:transposase
MAELQLRKESNEDTLHSGGKVTYRVYDGDRWIGWVGDGRKWQGHRYGAQRWWACWREDGDSAARWSTGLRFAKRQDAVDGLAARIAGAVEVLPTFDPCETRTTLPEPDMIRHQEGVEYAIWGRTVTPADEQVDPVPAVYSDASTVEVGELRLTHAEAEQLLVRLRNAITYERGRVGHPLLIAIDADCPGCSWPERHLTPSTGVFGCSKCTYTSTERNA